MKFTTGTGPFDPGRSYDRHVPGRHRNGEVCDWPSQYPARHRSGESADEGTPREQEVAQSVIGSEQQERWELS